MRVTMGGAVVVGMGVTLFSREKHRELDAVNVRLLSARPMQVVAGEFEFFEFAFERLGIDAEVDHGADEHVSAEAAEDVEVECFHC